MVFRGEYEGLQLGCEQFHRGECKGRRVCRVHKGGVWVHLLVGEMGVDSGCGRGGGNARTAVEEKAKHEALLRPYHTAMYCITARRIHLISVCKKCLRDQLLCVQSNLLEEQRPQRVQINT